jgi:hypothetical protein
MLVLRLVVLLGVVLVRLIQKIPLLQQGSGNVELVVQRGFLVVFLGYLIRVQTVLIRFLLLKHVLVQLGLVQQCLIRRQYLGFLQIGVWLEILPIQVYLHDF